MTSHEYAVHVTTDVDQVNDDLIDDLMDTLTHSGRPSMLGGRLSVQLTVPADNFAQATADGIHAVLSALWPLGRREVAIRCVEVMTEAAFTEWLEQPRADDLIPVAEQAGILGVSRQRVAQIAATDPRFPPATQVGRALLRSAPAIRRYADQRSRQVADA